ncbi:uncharacterized protein [Triticum aestivum]|uniref:uncharacterized protein n=1 Tax=Triticum aestivum TaxID=4565 RepID=UPI001D0194FB|nr:uncharacterized protein LOC123097023 [Triticum aestivum]
MFADVPDAHKEHPLVLRRVAGADFVCSGCACNGAGFRYRCDACDFDLHEFCATCPPTALLPFHGQHPLTFEPAVAYDDGRVCDLCETRIYGMHYRCRPTAFDVHPVCSQLPAAAVSPLHPEHLVVLTVARPTKCTRCSTDCLWRYRCSPCGVDLHPSAVVISQKTPRNLKTIANRYSFCFLRPAPARRHGPAPWDSADVLEIRRSQPTRNHPPPPNRHQLLADSAAHRRDHQASWSSIRKDLRRQAARFRHLAELPPICTTSHHGAAPTCTCTAANLHDLAAILPRAPSLLLGDSNRRPSLSFSAGSFLTGSAAGVVLPCRSFLAADAYYCCCPRRRRLLLLLLRPPAVGSPAKLELQTMSALRCWTTVPWLNRSGRRRLPAGDGDTGCTAASTCWRRSCGVAGLPTEDGVGGAGLGCGG